MIETTIRTDEACVCISRENYRKSIENLCKVQQIKGLVNKTRHEDRGFVDIEKLEEILYPVSEITVPEFMGGGANGKLV